MNKKPFVTKEQLDEITAKFPTPYHLYDEKGIRDNAKAVKEAFAWNKGYREYFAVKACPNPTLIQIMKEYGCGCDCSSMTELMLSKAMGCKGADIMFSSKATPGRGISVCSKTGKQSSTWMILPILIFWKKLSDIFRRPSAVVTIRVDSLKSAMISWITRESKIRYDHRTAL